MEEYPFWDERYALEGKIWGDQPSESARIAQPQLRARGVSDLMVLGCGYGRNSEFFAASGISTTGLDSSSEAIAIARQKSGAVIYLKGSVFESEDWRGPYDGIFCANVLHLFPEGERRRLIEVCRKQLTRAGTAFFSVFSDQDFTYGRGEETEPGTFESRPGRLAHYFREDELEAHFEGFKLLRSGLVEERESHPPDGDHVHLMRYVLLEKAEE